MKRRAVPAFGTFEGRVLTEWVTRPGADRAMVIQEPFAFIDTEGTRWIAAVGDEIDGASIPRFLWSVAGSPFTGEYRRATVLHDVYCRRRSRPSRDVHRMFYMAMRADGVSEQQAQQFYTAVRLFGPNWGARAAKAPRSFDQVEGAIDVVLNEPTGKILPIVPFLSQKRTVTTNLARKRRKHL